MPYTDTETLLYSGPEEVLVVDADGYIEAAGRLTLPVRAGYQVEGQSLAAGFHSTPTLTTTQVYANDMFGGGTKSSLAGNAYGGTIITPGLTTLSPLVEDSLSFDGASGYGEAVTTQATNGIIEWAQRRKAIAPGSNKWCGANSSVSGTSIAQHIDGGRFWYFMRDQLLAKRNQHSAIGESYEELLMAWIQGPSDVDAGTTGPTYTSSLVSLVTSLQTLTYYINNQRHPLLVQLVQSSYQVLTNNGVIALAQTAAIAPCNGLLVYATPDWIFPHFVDGIHLTNLGEDLMAAYLARNGYQAIFEKRTPDFFNPISCSYKDGYYWLLCDPPSGQVAIDGGHVTTQEGWFINDSVAGNIPLSGITVVGTNMIQAAGAAPTGVATCRLGLDALGAGWSVDANSATCNFRDTSGDTDILTQGGVPYRLDHWCPHASLPVIRLADSL